MTVRREVAEIPGIPVVIDDRRFEVGKRTVNRIGRGGVRIRLAGGRVGHPACQFQFRVGNGVIRVKGDLHSVRVLGIDSPDVQREARLGGVRRAHGIARRNRGIDRDDEGKGAGLVAAATGIGIGQTDGVGGTGGQGSWRSVIDGGDSVGLADARRDGTSVERSLDAAGVEGHSGSVGEVDGETSGRAAEPGNIREGRTAAIGFDRRRVSAAVDQRLATELVFGQPLHGCGGIIGVVVEQPERIYPGCLDLEDHQKVPKRMTATINSA